MKTKAEITALFKRYPQLLDPMVRHDFVIKWSCRNGTPNGDPDREGAPRELPDQRLWVTEACYKRMLRDYMEEVLGVPIYISRKAKEQGKSLKDLSQAYPKAKEAIAQFSDVRTLGGVYLAAGSRGSAQSDSQNAPIIGPFQIEIGTTDDRVEVVDASISRILKEDSSDGTFGRKHFVLYAEITHFGRYSAYLGKKVGITSEDMAHFWEAVFNAPELRQSTMSGRRRHVRLDVTSFTDAYGMGDQTSISIE